MGCGYVVTVKKLMFTGAPQGIMGKKNTCPSATMSQRDYLNKGVTRHGEGRRVPKASSNHVEALCLNALKETQSGECWILGRMTSGGLCCHE